MHESFDIAIIGAGIVGCATARHLAHALPDRSIIVLERRAGPGLETSAASSGVIHSGLHLEPKSLKARCARLGRLLTIDACTAYGVPMHHCGMHVVVSPGDVVHLTGEMAAFRQLFHRAKAQGIRCSIVGPWAVRRREPAVRCCFGVHIPDVTVIDVPALVRAYAYDAMTHRVVFRYGVTVHAVSRSRTQFFLTSTSGEIIGARAVINAAGLGATMVAAAAGYVHHRVTLYRGEYYEVTDPELRAAVHGLVYPVYRPGSPGLGIHLTKTMDGRLLVGPNAIEIPSPEAIDERRTPPEAFLSAVQPFLPALRLEHLRYDHAGIRTKLNTSAREADFCIALDHQDPPFVNCIGIESPGVTAAPAIAEHIATFIVPRLHRSRAAMQSPDIPAREC